MFDRVCREHDIEHRFTKPNHPWTNGQVERMNRSLNEATIKRYHYDTHRQLEDHLAAFLDAYNFAKRWRSKASHPVPPRGRTWQSASRGDVEESPNFGTLFSSATLSVRFWRQTAGDALISRRNFLVTSAVGYSSLVAASAFALTIPREVPWLPGQAPTPRGVDGARFFTNGERRCIDAVTSRLIPTDETGPGAREAGVVDFIDNSSLGSTGAATVGT